MSAAEVAVSIPLTATFADLPLEVVECIIQKLELSTAEDIVNVSLVNKMFYDLVLSSSCWRDAVMEVWFQLLIHEYVSDMQYSPPPRMICSRFEKSLR
jgi:hypothetical protein